MYTTICFSNNIFFQQLKFRFQLSKFVFSFFNLWENRFLNFRKPFSVFLKTVFWFSKNVSRNLFFYFHKVIFCFLKPIFLFSENCFLFSGNCFYVFTKLFYVFLKPIFLFSEFFLNCFLAFTEPVISFQNLFWNLIRKSFLSKTERMNMDMLVSKGIRKRRLKTVIETVCFFHST